jgi:hypothetical protein
MEADTHVISTHVRKEIGRNELTEKKITKNHALTLVESTGNELTTEALAMKKLHELNESKQQIKNVAKNIISTMIIKRASELDVKYEDTSGNLIPVSSYQDVGMSWKQNTSKRNAVKMFDILFGQFEISSIHWRAHMEKEIMNELKIKYSDNTVFRNKESGCVSKIITLAKNEIIRNINRQGKLFHGKSIGVANPKGTGKKAKRRTPGAFMDSFVRSNGTTETCQSDLKVRMSILFLNMRLPFHVLTY